MVHRNNVGFLDGYSRYLLDQAPGRTVLWHTVLVFVLLNTKGGNPWSGANLRTWLLCKVLVHSIQSVLCSMHLLLWTFDLICFLTPACNTPFLGRVFCSACSGLWSLPDPYESVCSCVPCFWNITLDFLCYTCSLSIDLTLLVPLTTCIFSLPVLTENLI